MTCRTTLCSNASIFRADGFTLWKLPGPGIRQFQVENSRICVLPVLSIQTASLDYVFKCIAIIKRDCYSPFLFALQDQRRITPRRLYRLRPDHNKCDQQYREQTNEQLDDMYGFMIGEIPEHIVFEEVVRYWQGNER